MNDETRDETSAVPGFVRPQIKPVTYRDAIGDVIPYGNHWPDNEPAQHSYSVTAHPERFQPAQTVATALIDHLAATYDVDVVEGGDAINDFVYPWKSLLRVVRLQPSDRDSAGITFAFSDFPDVSAHAGVTADLSFLNCGCDACDETWESVSDEMEEKVGSIVIGGFTETVRTGIDLTHETIFDGVDGAGTTTTWSPADEAILQRMEERNLPLPWSKTWKPWSRR